MADDKEKQKTDLGEPNAEKNEKKSSDVFDFALIDDDAFGKVFDDQRLWTHARFKGLLEKAKKADEYEASLSKQEEEKLKEQQQFQELANKKSEEALRWQKKFEDMVIDNAIMLDALKFNAIDVDAVTKLVDRAKISNEETGVSGVTEALKELVERKPYLFKDSALGGFGSGSQPSNVGVQPMFKLSQLQNAKFYAENQDAIEKAMKEGRVENDLNPAQG